MKKIGAVIAACAAIIGGSVLFAPAADAAAYGCSGNEIGSYAVRSATTGATFANAHLYYDSSTGKNCAVTVATTAGGAGHPHQISVFLSACTETSPNPNTCHETGTPAEDSGTYSSYAGPRSVYAPGKCIYLYATDTYDFTYASYSSGAFHCG